MKNQVNRSLMIPCRERAVGWITTRICSSVAALLLLVGCASYGKVANAPSDPSDTQGTYSLRAFEKRKQSSGQPDDISFVLAFSGGGTRAAAMAYGVLVELRDTQIRSGGQQIRLLDEVDHISSVSGGSFTAAFYGLHGDEFFNIFEDEFLRRDMNKALGRRLMNPVLWFSTKGRTEMAVEYYDKVLFHDATFADMNKPGRPMIVINASDLAYGVRFSFIQEYFDLLCSDLSTFPISRAVTASSAVPVVFNPIIVENHSGCGSDIINWPADIDEKRKQDAELNDLYNGLQTYQNKEDRKYIHLVDGGITDNMGLRAIYDLIQVAGGAKEYMQKAGETTKRQVVVISVNASAKPIPEMDKTTKQPSMLESMNAMSGVQLHRYNSATQEVLEGNLSEWAKQLSTPEAPVTSYFIPVRFEDVDQPQLRFFLNKIPTTFSLDDEQVDALIESGREVLRKNPVFQQLLSDMPEQ